MNPIKRISLLVLFALLTAKPCTAQFHSLTVKPDVKKAIVEVSAGLSDDGINSGKKVLATLSFFAFSSRLPGYPKPVTRSLIIPPRKGEGSYSVTVKGWNPDQFWRPNSPFRANYRVPLHHLTLTLTRGKKTLQTLEKKFVLCEMQSDESGYRLNGKPIALKQMTLKGNERLDGGTLDIYLQRGVNVLRAKEIPFSEAIVKLCRFQGMISIQPDGKGDAGGIGFRAVAPIPEAVLTTLQLLERDTKTQGNWLGVYGKEAFFVSIPDGSSFYAIPEISLSRNTIGYRIYGKGEPLDDPRLMLSAPGSTLRYPHAFTELEEALIFRVKSTDTKPHLFSLYFLDYPRRKDKLKLRFYDGNAYYLGKTEVTDFGEGVYVRGRFTGELVIEILNSDPLKEPTAWGMFVDPN